MTRSRSFGESDGRRQFDVAHAFAPDLGFCHFHAAPVADDAFVFNLLVFAAMAFPVLHRAENLFAEQPVFFGLGRPVIDRFGSGYLAVRPFAYLLRRGQTYSYGLEII
jgi:hypothetical protein